MNIYRQENPNILKDEFGEKIDFSLKKGEKVKISNNKDKKEKK